uniref:Peptidase A2 domain-containing protein n=1 Tax=Meloidogyne floridensis TaxID=298350 RepID=A0A915PG87_9BILA
LTQEILESKTESEAPTPELSYNSCETEDNNTPKTNYTDKGGESSRSKRFKKRLEEKEKKEKRKKMDELTNEMQNLNVKITSLGAKPPINLEIFKGRKDVRTFASFINAYNKVATAYNWDEQTMARMFPLFLSKDSQFLYDSLTKGEKSNWNLLIDRMAKKFAVGESVSHFRRVASSRKQRVNESISDFSEAISQLVDKGYPDSGGFNEEIRRGLAIEFFRNGLRPELREQLRKMTKPATMAEAAIQAIEEEEALHELAREKLANVQFDQINEINQINQIAQETSKKAGFKNNFRNNSERPINKSFNKPFSNFRRKLEPFRNVNWRMPRTPYWRNTNQNNYNRSQNYYNRNQNDYNKNQNYNSNVRNANRPQFNNFGRGNSNFVPLSNRGGRRRSRGGYKINSINTTRKSPSPVFPLLTILAILLCEYLSYGYQVCIEEEQPMLLAPPEKANCSIPQGPNYEEYNVEIYVPQKRALIFSGFKCQKLIFGRSAFSFLRLYNEDDDFLDKLSPVSKEDCWKLVREGKLGNKILRRENENVLRSKTQMKVEYPVFGTNYFYEYDYVVQIGNVYVNMDTKMVKSDLGFYENCTIPERKCEEENSTLIWDDPTEFYCPYESAGNFRALLSYPYILVENLQAVFIFSNFFTGNVTLGERECFGPNTYYMENDVFISIPKLKDFPGTTFHAVGIKPELDGDRELTDEELNKIGKTRDRRDVAGLKRARKLTTTTPENPTSSPSTESPTSSTITESPTPRTTETPTSSTIKESPTPGTTETSTSTAGYTEITKGIDKRILTLTPTQAQTTKEIVTNKQIITTEKNQIDKITEKPFVDIRGKIYKTREEAVSELSISKETKATRPQEIQKAVTKSIAEKTISPNTVTETPITKSTKKLIPTTTSDTSTNRVTLTESSIPKTIITQIITESTLKELTTTKQLTSTPQTTTIIPKIGGVQKIETNLVRPRPLINTQVSEKVTFKPTTTQIPVTETPTTEATLRTSSEPKISTSENLKRARISRPKILQTPKQIHIEKIEIQEKKNNKIVEDIAKIYGIKMKKRETPWDIGNKTFTTPTTIKESQGNLNTKLQFLESFTQEIVKKNFDKLWVQICDIHNRQVETAKTIMTVDPTLGSRLWLRKQDITAKFYGEAIGISKCHQVNPNTIFWNHEINGECFEKVPIKIVEGNISKILFLVSESYAQDLVESSEKIECSKRPKSVFKDENGKWRTYEGPTSVESMPNLLPYKPEKTRVIFKAETIFQSDLNGLMASISALHNYANRINKVEKILRERNITYENDTNILLKIGQNVKESVETGIRTAINITSTLAFLTQNLLVVGVIAAVIIGVLFILGLVIYFYPWIRPIVSARGRRRNNINQIEKAEQYEINALAQNPSAPPIENEIEMQAIIHTKIPKIYQISHFKTYSIHPQLKQPVICIKVGNQEFKALADSGASISYCKQSIAKKLGKIEFDLQPNVKAVVASSDQFYMIGKINLKGEIGDIPFETKIYVAEDKHCPSEILLGSDFWEAFQRNTGFEVSFDWINERLKLVNFLNNELQSIAMVASIQIINEERKVKIIEKCELEPHSDTLVPAEIQKSQNNFEKSILIRAGNNKLSETIIIGKTLCEPDKIFVRVLNVGNSKITLFPKQNIAEWEEIQEIDQINSVELVEDRKEIKQDNY